MKIKISGDFVEKEVVRMCVKGESEIGGEKER